MINLSALLPFNPACFPPRNPNPKTSTPLQARCQRYLERPRIQYCTPHEQCPGTWRNNAPLQSTSHIRRLAWPEPPSPRRWSPPGGTSRCPRSWAGFSSCSWKCWIIRAELASSRRLISFRLLGPWVTVRAWILRRWRSGPVRKSWEGVCLSRTTNSRNMCTVHASWHQVQPQRYTALTVTIFVLGNPPISCKHSQTLAS